MNIQTFKKSALKLYKDHAGPIQPVVHKLMIEKGIAFARRAGLKVDVLERGRAVLRMPIKGNTNHIGTMYAGALFTLAEMPGGALYLSSFDTERYVPIVTEMTIRYHKPAKGPVTVDVRLSEAEILRLQQEADENGKASFQLEAELKSAAGEVVATTTGQYQLRAKSYKR